MKTPLLKFAALCLACLCAAQALHAQGEASEAPPRFVFRFMEGDDMLYVPYQGNDARLDSLCLMLIRQEREEGAVRVDGYSATRSLSMVLCNRVKSELILRCGMEESHFATTNNAGTFNGMRNVVIVTLPAAEDGELCPQPEEPAANPSSERPGWNEPLPEFPFREEEQPQPESAPGEEPVSDFPASPTELCDVSCAATGPARWSVGLNVGIPLFWGDMVSMAYDKTYIGIAAGVQGSYRFSHLLGITLSAEYAHGKAGARDYSRGYAVAPDGMTTYGPQTAAVTYGDLYSRISAVNVGLSLDVNVNRIFSREAYRHRFTVWVSPTIYGQFFSARLFSKADDSQFSDGSLRPASLSLGLGGALTLRYRVSGSLELQLKNSLIWITDNNFDAIATPYGKARQNAMWTPQLGIVWNIKQ